MASDSAPLGHRRQVREWTIIAVVVAMTLGSLGVAGLLHRSHRATTAEIVIASGITNGTRWSLTAQEDSGQLCMLFEQDPQLTSGGCGFDARPSGGFAASGPGIAGGPDVSFGPLPAKAVAVRLASHLTIAARSFPSGMGLPRANFWLFIPPSDWPAPAVGTVLESPQPLAADGSPVAFTNF